MIYKESSRSAKHYTKKPCLGNPPLGRGVLWGGEHVIFKLTLHTKNMYMWNLRKGVEFGGGKVHITSLLSPPSYVAS